MNKKIIAAVAGTFVLGCIVGSAGNSDAATPTSTKTITVPGPERTVTNTVSKVPQACLDALDAADTQFGHAGKGFLAVSKFMNAVTNSDMSAMTSAEQEMSSEEGALDMTSYSGPRDECRAASN